MLSYFIDDGILVIVPKGMIALPERRAVYQKIRHDPNVPDSVCVLVDARGAPSATPAAVRERAQIMVAELAPKTIRVCAVLLPRDGQLEAHAFRDGASNAGVRVGLFSDESLARQWLSAYQV